MSHFLLHTYVYTHGWLLFLAFFSFFLQWVIVNTEIHNSSECGVQIVAEFLAISGTTIIDLTPPKAQGTSRIGSGNFVRPRHYWRVLWNNAFWHEMAIILMNSLHFYLLIQDVYMMKPITISLCMGSSQRDNGQLLSWSCASKLTPL